MYGYEPEEFRQIGVGAISEGNPPYSQNEAVEWIQRACDGSRNVLTGKQGQIRTPLLDRC